MMSIDFDDDDNNNNKNLKVIIDYLKVFFLLS